MPSIHAFNAWLVLAASCQDGASIMEALWLGSGAVQLHREPPVSTLDGGRPALLILSWELPGRGRAALKGALCLFGVPSASKHQATMCLF